MPNVVNDQHVNEINAQLDHQELVSQLNAAQAQEGQPTGMQAGSPSDPFHGALAQHPNPILHGIQDAAVGLIHGAADVPYEVANLALKAGRGVGELVGAAGEKLGYQGLQDAGHAISGHLGMPGYMQQYHQFVKLPPGASTVAKAGEFAGSTLPLYELGGGIGLAGKVGGALEKAAGLTSQSPLAARMAISAAKLPAPALQGALVSEAQHPHFSPEADIATGLASALTYGASEALGTRSMRFLESLKHPQEAAPFTAEAAAGERLSPHIGGQIGDVGLQQKFQKLTQTPFSGAADIENIYGQRQAVRKQREMAATNQSSRDLMKNLGGGQGTLNLPESISEDIQDIYDKHNDLSTRSYNAIDKKLPNIKFSPSDVSNTKNALQELSQDYKTDKFFTKPSADIPAPLQKVIEKVKRFMVPTRTSTILDKSGKPIVTATKNVSDLKALLDAHRGAMKEANNLYSGGNIAEARPYKELGVAFKKDMENITEKKNPVIHELLKSANEHFRTNVMPFRENTTTNPMVYPKFDVPHAPHNLSSALTSGKAVDNAVLEIMPQSTKNKIAAHLLGNVEEQKGLITPDHAHLISKSKGANKPHLLKRLISPSHQRQLDRIRQNVEKNKSIFKEREKIATEQSSPHLPQAYLGSGGHITMHANPWNLMHSPLGRYNTELLTSPSLRREIVHGERGAFTPPREPWFAHRALHRGVIFPTASYLASQVEQPPLHLDITHYRR